MRVLFIFNHRSGTGITGKMLRYAVDAVADAGISARYVPGIELMKEGSLEPAELLSFDRIICYGGDGTLNLLVNRLYQMGILDKVEIGYIPGGSTNDFGAGINVPSVRKKALEVALTGNIIPIDVGKFNGRTFNYVAAFGLFTQASYSTDQNLKNVLGHGAYILTGAASLFNLSPVHIKVVVDNTAIEGDFIMGMVTNARQVGGFWGVTGSSVDLQDGLFEVTLIRQIKDPAELTDLVTLFAEEGKLLPRGEGPVVRLSGSKITVRGDDKIDWTLDGEFGGSVKKASINVIPGGLRIATPG